MVERPARIGLLFVDGLGWGPADPACNPGWSYGGQRWRWPEPPPPGQVIRLMNGAWACALDACLGVPGLPQSATGQTTLLTGQNAQQIQGRHLSGFPGPTLRKVLLEHSVLKRLREAGKRPVFFNTFRAPFFDWPREQQLRLSATTIANLAADLPFFDVPDMAAGRSLYQEFTGEELQSLGFEAPLYTPTEAGTILGRNLAAYDFLLYEYFRSDKVGHSGNRQAAEAELHHLEEFLAAVVAARPADTLLLLCSDHGNLEDVCVTTHTRNPVPLVAWGPGAEAFVGGKTRLDQVTPGIIDWLV